MKYLLKSFAYALVMFTFFNCATESVDSNLEENLLTPAVQQELEPSSDTTCNGYDPKARLANHGTIDFDLEIYDESGALLNAEYGIEPGSFTVWTTFPPGEITFVVGNANAQKIVVIDMGTCMAYDMLIGENNQLSSDQPIYL